MDIKDSATLASLSNSIIHPSVPRPLKKLYRGEPMALGITQILIGILEISFGLVVAIARGFPYNGSGYHLTTPYWLGILYIISGSLSVAAAKDPKVPLVKGMLAMNVVSSVAAGIAIVIFSISLEHFGYFYSRCNSYYLRTMPPDICHEYVTIPHDTMHAISALLLIVTVLEFLISIITAAFGCATMCRNAYSETTVVIFQKTDEGTALPRQMYENVEA